MNEKKGTNAKKRNNKTRMWKKRRTAVDTRAKRQITQHTLNISEYFMCVFCPVGSNKLLFFYLALLLALIHVLLFSLIHSSFPKTSFVSFAFYIVFWYCSICPVCITWCTYTAKATQTEDIFSKNSSISFNVLYAM